ncbi:MAG: flagellar biosynthesis anti-sigma factor FlgM [Burkholderiaceae bacterium]
MRIVANNVDKNAAQDAKSGAVSESARVDKTAATLGAAPAVLGAAPATALESSHLQPAQQALAAMPEIDQAKVDALREALSRGEISFDANRLASLIQRFHGGRG